MNRKEEPVANKTLSPLTQAVLEFMADFPPEAYSALAVVLKALCKKGQPRQEPLPLQEPPPLPDPPPLPRPRITHLARLVLNDLLPQTEPQRVNVILQRIVGSGALASITGIRGALMALIGWGLVAEKHVTPRLCHYSCTPEGRNYDKAGGLK